MNHFAELQRHVSMPLNIQSLEVMNGKSIVFIIQCAYNFGSDPLNLITSNEYTSTFEMLVLTCVCSHPGPNQQLDSAIAAAELLGQCPAAAGVLLRGCRHKILAEAAVAELASAAAASEARNHDESATADHTEGVHIS